VGTAILVKDTGRSGVVIGLEQTDISRPELFLKSRNYHKKA